jgi:plastocyanin
MKRTALVTGTAAVLLAAAAACGSSSGSSSGAGGTGGTTGGSTQSAPPSASAPATSAAKITIASFAFTTPLTVSPGATVTVTNTDSADHTVTADNASFDVSVPAGQTVTFTAPSTAGSFSYHCTIHPTMHGTLIVK